MQTWTLVIIGFIVIGAIIYLLTRNSSLAVGDPKALQADARRFARLLVAEIRLYNEAKIERGKRADDIYSQLETEINDARKMYDRKIPNNLMDKDYFDEQIIELLADGDAGKLGARYAESKNR